MPCGKFSVSEIRKPKIFHQEWKIDANYFGFRISETEMVSTNFPFPAENFRFPKFGNRNSFHQFCLETSILQKDQFFSLKLTYCAENNHFEPFSAKTAKKVIMNNCVTILSYFDRIWSQFERSPQKVLKKVQN